MQSPRVVAVTVTYGRRWHLVSQVIKEIMEDLYVVKLVIVDNASKNKEEIEEGVKEYGDKIVLLREEINTGSAGGFSRGLSYARDIECDYIFVLDDDNVPEKGAIEQFLEIKKLFTNTRVVLVADRPNLQGSQDFFYTKPLERAYSRGTFFEVFSFRKIIHFIKISTGFSLYSSLEKRPFIPILPNESFIYGGSFLPVEAVRDAPLPDASLVLYGDDIEYSWGIKKLGYDSYVCVRPRVYDIDTTFTDGSHISGLFDPKTHAFKVYYRIRNMVRISIRNTYQPKIVLFLSISIWIIGLCGIGLITYGISKVYFKRFLLIIQAVYGGYNKKYKTPEEAKLP